MRRTVPNGKIAWIFPRVMGTDTLFNNLRESASSEVSARSVWIGLNFGPPGRFIQKLPLPHAVRVSLDLLFQAEAGLRSHPDVASLVVANLPPSPVYLPLVMRYATYFYLDLTPSLVQELSPWYDRLLPRKGFLGLAQNALLRVTYQMAAGILALSEWAGAAVHREFGVPRERIHVAPPGANLRRWAYVDRTGKDPRSPVNILMVGRDFERKGGEILLEWAARTSAQNYELNLVTAATQPIEHPFPVWLQNCIGDSVPEGRSAAMRIPGRPRVRMHFGLNANTPELLALYREADIFCLPTLGDASPIAILEAMATGLPVVVSALGGIPELVWDGKTGFLFRPADVDDLDTKLQALIDNEQLRGQTGKAARAACEEYLNVERLLQQIVNTVDPQLAFGPGQSRREGPRIVQRERAEEHSHAHESSRSG